METKGIQRTFVVSFDHAHGDKPVLIVGEEERKPVVGPTGVYTKGIMKVVAAYEDQEAVDIYNSLVKGEKHESDV